MVDAEDAVEEVEESVPVSEVPEAVLALVQVPLELVAVDAVVVDVK